MSPDMDTGLWPQVGRPHLGFPNAGLSTRSLPTQPGTFTPAPVSGWPERGEHPSTQGAFAHRFLSSSPSVEHPPCAGRCPELQGLKAWPGRSLFPTPHPRPGSLSQENSNPAQSGLKAQYA